MIYIHIWTVNADTNTYGKNYRESNVEAFDLHTLKKLNMCLKFLSISSLGTNTCPVEKTDANGLVTIRMHKTNYVQTEVLKGMKNRVTGYFLDPK